MDHKFSFSLPQGKKKKKGPQLFPNNTSNKSTHGVVRVRTAKIKERKKKYIEV